MFSLGEKTKKIFYKILAIALLSFVVLLVPAIVLFNKTSQVWLSWQGKLETVCGCVVNFVFFDHPFLFSIIGLVFAGFILFIVWGTSKTIKIRLATNKFIKINVSCKKRSLSGKLRVVAKEINLNNKIVEVNNQEVGIFCYGFFIQKICISATLVKKFNKEELKAVLLHEQHHLMVHGNIRLFIVNVLRKVLFFIPGLGLLVKKYSIFSELAADEWAIKHSAGSSSIAKAIYKLLERRETVFYSFVPSFSSSTEERINKLVDSNYNLDKKVFTKRKILENLFILTLIFSFSFFMYSTKLNAVEHDREMCDMDMSQGCVSEKELIFCSQEISINKLLCHD